MKVKICGITRLDDALVAAQAGADFIGLNFYEPSPRAIHPQLAKQLCADLRQQLGTVCPLIVGVFVNMPVHDVQAIVTQVGLDAVQLSGDESLATFSELDSIVFKALRPHDIESALASLARVQEYAPTDTRFPSLVLDAYHAKLYGGTGKIANQDLALALKDHVPRLMLAGGLTPDNIAERVKTIQPWGVDVASGVEAGEAGFKSATKMRNFIKAAQS